MTLRQVEKVLRKAGVKYYTCKQTIDLGLLDGIYITIVNLRDTLFVRIGNNLNHTIEFKFNSLTSDGDSLYFSYKSQEPLIVKIK